VHQALMTLGVKHIRDTLLPAGTGNGDRLNAIYRYLADYDGIKVLAGMPRPSASSASPWALAATAAGPLRGALDGIEGPNEMDLTGGDWVTSLRIAQTALVAAVRARPELAGVPVVGPSMARSNSWAAGDLSAVSDRGNIHPYAGWHRPGDWTGLTSAATLSRFIHGNKPLWATELGYHNAVYDPTTFPPVSERAAGAYAPQTVLVGAVRGLARMYFYELVDEQPDPWRVNREMHFGLFDTSFTPKPAGIALSRLMTLLGGRPGAAPAGGLDLSVSGASDVRSVLLRRADGAFLVALWHDVDLWDPTMRRDLRPAGGPVTVRLAAPADVAVEHLLADSAPVSVASSASSVTVPVPADDTTVLVVKPTGRAAGATTYTPDMVAPAAQPGQPEATAAARVPVGPALTPDATTATVPAAAAKAPAAATKAEAETTTKASKAKTKSSKVKAGKKRKAKARRKASASRRSAARRVRVRR
jgi:hypothetical protein